MRSDLINRLRSKLDAGSCIGVFSKTTDSALVEASGQAGLDFIILDTEHGPIDWERLQDHVRAANLTEMAPIVRVRGIDPHAIGAALDAGATGVQVPNIADAQQARAAVEAARFHPLGQRGVCRFVRAADYGAKEKQEYFALENQKLLILQVEGLDGVRNLDDILRVKGFDILFIGPYDLSQSVGKPGQIDADEVQELIRVIRSKAEKAGLKLGIFCDRREILKYYLSIALPYIAYSVDLSLYREAVLNLTADN